MILIEFLIIFLLILLNGIFVAAEFSIIGVRPSRISQLAEEGHVTAKRVQKILKNPAQVDRYIASAQLGITLASLGLGMYGEPVIAHLIEPILHDTFGINENLVHTVSFFIALGFITYFHVVIGEMIPKSLALQSAERVVFFLSTPMLIMQSVFSVAITVLNRIGVWILTLMRIPPTSETSRLHTPDELELIISDSVVGGLIEAVEEKLLHNIFDFGELHVVQIMTPRPKINAVSIDISKEDLLEKMFTAAHNRFPVYENDLDHILGIIHLKDLVHLHLDNTPYDLKELLHEIPFVPEGLFAEELLKRLKHHQVHMAIVIDEYGGTAGLVTMEDILEEVVGEVRDEFDINEQDHIALKKPGYLTALGITRLDELQEYVDLSGDEQIEDVDTVGGLMVATIPLPVKVNEEVTINGVTFRVESVNGLVVERVGVYFQADSTPDNKTH